MQSQTAGPNTAANSTPKASLLLGGAVLIALLVFTAYNRTLQSGFTLDDFSHIGYAWQTCNGHPEALISKLFGSWTSGKEDGIIAYRPTTCTTFALDCAIWQARAYGWHLSNLIIYFLDCIFTALVTYELLWRARIPTISAAITAFMAAAFMALYPGHPDSAVTIVGRVDGLPTAFYMAAIYFHLLYRSTTARKYQLISLLSFWLALGSKETAVTLPIVLLLGEALNLFAPPGPMPKTANSEAESEATAAEDAQSTPANQLQAGAESTSSLSWKAKLLDAAKVTAPYFFVLTAFAVLRTVVLHGQVGGYGKIHLKTMLRQLLGFADRATLMKILLPINEHFPLPATYSQGMLLVYALATLNFLSQAARNKRLAMLALFLALFAIINVLLTFQIWHIYPNLVGFRLFFLSSTAFCIFLAVGLPVDRKSPGLSFLNILAAVFLSVIWTITLNNNLGPFLTAGEQVQQMQKDLNTLAKSRTGTERILLKELPQDYCGAPMVGRAAFLAVMLEPPVNGTDIRPAFVIAENGTGKLVALDTMSEYPRTAFPAVYRWDNSKGQLVAAPAQ